MKKKTKVKKRLLSMLLTLTMVLGMFSFTTTNVHAGGMTEGSVDDDIDFEVWWGEEYGEGVVTVHCPYCSSWSTRDIYDGDYWAAVYDIIDSEFLDCGHCEDCADDYHCSNCKGCFEAGDVSSCSSCDSSLCLDCHLDEYFCDNCGECRLSSWSMGDDFYDEITGGYLEELDLRLCAGCLADKEECANCGNMTTIVGYSVADLLGEEWCETCNLCRMCVHDPDSLVDFGHCVNCGVCGYDEEVCFECHLCETCSLNETHCAECDSCFGAEGIQWCEDGGDHCVNCCEDNDWVCDHCDQCMETLGLERCDDCGMCTDCCLDISEEAGCDHGYCVFSSEYEDHLCPECMTCPRDTECDDCGLCEDCQDDYHCEHGLCPDGSEWDDHLCEDCGECCDPDNLCDWCGKCPDCQENYHCEHNICPDDPLVEDDGDHFICTQCGSCFEGTGRCPDCLLCMGCCSDNTADMGCAHGYCIESGQFADHWCYADNQCEELCEHDEDCEHNNVTEVWSKDDAAHWHVCLDCGASVDEENHKAGALVIVQDPDPVKKKNGVAETSCSVCGEDMGLVSVPYVTPPADGSPFIITQPRDYTGKVSDVVSVGIDRYATFTVQVGGEGTLTYQWYMYRPEYNPAYRLVELEDKTGEINGAQTNSLTVYVYGSTCYEDWQFYCVITGAKGQITTRYARMDARHDFGNYVNNGDGTHSYFCNGDGCQETKGAPEKHRYSAWEIKYPTSTEAGFKKQKCLDCGAVNQITSPALGHDHVHNYKWLIYGFDKNSATHAHWKVCDCGAKTPVEAHTYDAGVVTKNPTYKEKGIKTFTCTVCHYKYTEEVPCKEHTHDYYEISPENCANPQRGGRNATQHWTYCKTGGCPVTGRARNAEKHVFGFWEHIDNPTVTQAGTYFRSCESCGYKEFQSYTGDETFMVSVVGGTATPITAKYGDKVTVTYTQVQGKQWSSDSYWEVVDGPSTNTPYVASNKVTLSPDKYSKTVTFEMPYGNVKLVADNLSACSHSRTETTLAVPATCTTGGFEPDTVCSDCGKVLAKGAAIPALGHDMEDEPYKIVELYCSSRNALNPYTSLISNPDGKGSSWYKCKRCSKTEVRQDRPLIHGLREYTPGEDTANIFLAEPVREGAKEASCTKAGKTGDLCCNWCNTILEKSEWIEATGHDWDDWEELVPATPKTKGQEIRTCMFDHDHTQRRVTDYSGPDYDLKANKTVIHFDFIYGETVEPVEITYNSVGRDTVNAIKAVSEQVIGNTVNIEVDGMKLRISPLGGGANMVGYMTGDHEILAVDSIMTPEGETDQFTASQIEITANVRKTMEKYNITVEGGVIRVGANQATTMQLRGGEVIDIIADDDANFVRWEVTDASGLIPEWLDNYSDWNDSRFWSVMSPNDVTIRAVYENDAYTVSKYSKEWVNGKWYNKDGTQTYAGIGKWHKSGKGWWYGDNLGWYAKNQWQKIDGKWYFFDKEGYMEKNAYRQGYYFTANGAWDGKAKVAGWKQNAKGWWYSLGGSSFLKNCWKKIDGNWYYFKANGYIATNEFVDGWWLDKNGVQSDPVKYSWHKTGGGWWYGVSGGWYAKNATYTIDGKSYTFDKTGYLK